MEVFGRAISLDVPAVPDYFVSRLQTKCALGVLRICLQAVCPP